jgi:hypothetical protein
MYAAMALTLSGVHRIHRSDVSEVREIRWGAWVAPGVGLADKLLFTVTPRRSH